MALPPEIKHLRDKLRRVLQVAIELNRAIARRRLVGGEQRALIAAVARKADDMHLRVPRRHVPQQREGAVGRMIVGEDDFVIIVGKGAEHAGDGGIRSEEHTSELQSLMRISYAVFCLKTKTTTPILHTYSTITKTSY